MRKFQLIGLTFISIFILNGCMAHKMHHHKMKNMMKHSKTARQHIKSAVAILAATDGNSVTGSVWFAKAEGGLKITAQITGLEPGTHGIHIHQYGDCSSGDGKSAGGHFNPGKVEHGGPEAEVRHIGDLGNIVADANGNAALEIFDSRLAFHGPHSIIGRGLIIHAKADDLVSQPTGAAGVRVACGVIGVAEGE